MTYGIHHTWHEHISQSYGRCRSESTSLTLARLWVCSMFYITVSRMEWGMVLTRSYQHIKQLSVRVVACLKCLDWRRSDLTPQFHLLDPTMVYKHRDWYVQWLRGTYTRRHLVADDRSNRRHLATVLGIYGHSKVVKSTSVVNRTKGTRVDYIQVSGRGLT